MSHKAIKAIELDRVMQFIDQYTISTAFTKFLSGFKGSSKFDFRGFDQGKICQLIHKINTNSSSKIQGTQEEGKCKLLEWKKGEFKLYFWVLAFYCFVHDIEAKHLVKYQ